MISQNIDLDFTIEGFQLGDERVRGDVAVTGLPQGVDRPAYGGGLLRGRRKARGEEGGGKISHAVSERASD